MTAVATDAPPGRRLRLSRPALLVLLFAALGVVCLLSVMIGTRSVPPADVLRGLTGSADPEITAIVRSVRIPRTAMGLLVAAALGLSGALMQSLTRNPLADPGLLGVTAGAAFAIVLAVAALGLTTLYGYILFAFLGALLASVLVYFLGTLGRGGATPVKLALAGVAVSALLGAITSGVVLNDSTALNRYRYWAAGSIAGLDTGVLARIAPFIAVGAVLALACAPSLNSLALGDAVARSLGRRVGLIRITGAVAVTLLTGAAVAACGPIVFIGLVVPHVARLLTGPDNRWLLPFAAVLSPVLLLGADVLGRVVARPGEINAGVIVAFLGGPFFIALVRRRRLAEL